MFEFKQKTKQNKSRSIAHSVTQEKKQNQLSNEKQTNQPAVLQLVMFNYTTEESGPKNMKPTDKLSSISNFTRNAGGDRRWDFGKSYSGWSSVGGKQNKNEGTKLNHSRKAELIKGKLINTYQGEEVQDILFSNQFATTQLGEEPYRTIALPLVLGNGKYEKKSKVSDYLNEGMQLIIEYPSNLFYWPKTKGDAGMDDDLPVQWQDESEVDLTGWIPDNWQLEETETRTALIESIGERLSEAREKLEDIGG